MLDQDQIRKKEQEVRELKERLEKEKKELRDAKTPKSFAEELYAKSKVYEDKQGRTKLQIVNEPWLGGRVAVPLPDSVRKREELKQQFCAFIDSIDNDYFDQKFQEYRERQRKKAQESKQNKPPVDNRQRPKANG